MNTLVRKELRLIAPAWGVAFVAMSAGPIAFGNFDINTRSLCIPTFCLAMVLLGLSPFGREFGSGSFSMLLAQPASRERLWQAKVWPLGAACLSLLVLSVFIWDNLGEHSSRDWREFWLGTLGGLAMLTGGLWTTLLFRQITAAIWITLLIPFLLTAGVSQVAGISPEPYIAMVLGLYFVVSFCWARRLFLRAQDVGWGGGEVSLPGFERWFGTGTRAVGESRHGFLAALIVKELRLHSMSLFCAAGMLVLHLAAIGVRKFGDEMGALRGTADYVGAFWFILPAILGAEAVASERQSGTMEGQLCLPARRRTQFAIKLSFTLVVGVILGGVMPWLIEVVANVFGAGADVLRQFRAFQNEFERTSASTLLGWCGFAAGLALTSLYASSLTGSTLQALGAAVVASVVVWMLALLGSPGPDPYQLWRWGLAHLIGGPALAVTLLGVSFWNFKRLHQAGQLWRRNLAVLGVWLAFTVVATPLVYLRAWELVLPLEPKHGPARITGAGGVEICHVLNQGPCAYILRLPSGRIWAGTEGGYRYGESTLTAGEFVEGSNWIALAATHSYAAAIKADGTLWAVLDYSQTSMNKHRVKATLRSPQRIGADADWVSLSASGGHFLALKQDGSIWGWGENSYNQLGDRPEPFISRPVRIGQESDWTAVFASVWQSAAVKRDGSLWMWGGFYHLPDGTPYKQIRRQSTPVRYNLPGTNLISLQSAEEGHYALYGDGSVQAVGRIRPPVLLPGSSLLSEEAKNWIAGWTLKPIRFNPSQDWRSFVLGERLLTLRADGSIWTQSGWWCRGDRPPYRKLSEYSDWVAVTQIPSAYGGQPLTLAADGTLCCWSTDQARNDPQALLRRSRRPLWSLNIFDSATASPVAGARP